MILCEFPAEEKWNLLYRASQDGFETAQFHSKCENKPNTLVVIKSTNGNVFSGYTEQSWKQTQTYDYKADPNSFIFSLMNKDNKPLKIKWSRNACFLCRNNYGPVYGWSVCGSDIVIKDKSNINKDSSSNLGASYTHPSYAFGPNHS